MIKEIRKCRDGNKATNIRTLQFKGQLKAYEKNGYAAYDTEEYALYKKTARRGRPLGAKNKHKKEE